MSSIISKSFLLIILNYMLVGQNLNRNLSIESKGQGGTFLHTKRSVQSYLNNPALLAGEQFKFNFSLPFTMDNVFFDYIDFYNSNSRDINLISNTDKTSETFKNALQNVLRGMQKLERKTFEFSMNPSIGIVMNQMMIGVYWDFKTYITPDVILMPKLELTGKSELVFFAAYGLNINEKIRLGSSIRYMNRNKADKVLIDLLEVSTDGFLAGVLDSLNKNSSGIAVDFGGTYTVNEDLSTAMVIRNMPSFIDNESLPIYVDLGARYQAPFNLNADLELIDLFNESKSSFFHRLNIGFSYVIPYIKIIELRSGFHSGYFTFGTGLDFEILQMNYAYFTEEQSRYIGKNPKHSHSIEVRVNF